MLDPRVRQLAEVLVGHSTELGPTDKVLIHTFDAPDEVAAELVRAAQKRGAEVVIRQERNVVKRRLMLGMTEANARTIAEIEAHEMANMTAYIAVRASDNISEHGDIPDDIQAMWQREYATPVVFGIRIPKTKWVVLRWPTSSMAQQASRSTEAFEDFYFKVCTLDYGRMAKASQPLHELMDRTDRVRIQGPGTDLTFSIKGIGSVPCSGSRNIPDGECFSAPVRDSVNGTIAFNAISMYQGTDFKGVRFAIERGKIVQAWADGQDEKINAILDTDEGARYFGEWSLGYNPMVLHPMKDTLFDEKIAGSFHLTPGNAYDPPGGNGNKSAIHWDLVCIQRPEYGGGEIYFDDRLIRKDGLFVAPELEGLNPDRLA